MKRNYDQNNTPPFWKVAWEAQMEDVIYPVSECQIVIDDLLYYLRVDYRSGFQLAAFQKRYSPILAQYDVIVGDWGYDQLRLKGFYHRNKSVPEEQTVPFIHQYLIEDCQYGCAYFILEKETSVTEEEDEAV